MAIGPNVITPKRSFLGELTELERLFSGALICRLYRDGRYNVSRTIISRALFNELRSRFLLQGWDDVRLIYGEDPEVCEVIFVDPRSDWEQFSISIAAHLDASYGRKLLSVPSSGAAVQQELAFS